MPLTPVALDAITHTSIVVPIATKTVEGMKLGTTAKSISRGKPVNKLAVVLEVDQGGHFLNVVTMTTFNGLTLTEQLEAGRIDDRMQWCPLGSAPQALAGHQAVPIEHEGDSLSYVLLEPIKYYPEGTSSGSRDSLTSRVHPVYLEDDTIHGEVQRLRRGRAHRMKVYVMGWVGLGGGVENSMPVPHQGEDCWNGRVPLQTLQNPSLMI
ncbi:uncharacterized protein F5891DRAFT_973647 [Suillus fuscotomentosus]|uniref:Uncharacterized protein n=1 Tax=Suillus fuscotomentosus TaxID=1912939 RepID=A0AAD4EL17_9AGAM|nr:uncharacterized protein F5891DRAFT_973647 [Suillus fuscotomentosus]KAG1908155.1 hypothetical protein F5891DRAFT_973647 [Suillus fuscotomentosus]